MTRERIFSGMQPSGELHIGNYLGALANWVRLAEEHEAVFCVVDQHAQTVEYDRAGLRARVRDFVIGWVSAGVDPETCVVFCQSDVPEHTELAWYLSTVTQFGELSRMTQFKDKSAQHTDNVNAALFTYPLLMAADILLYKATTVPVGDDQTQHIELARDIAHRFNARYGETFPLPKARLSTTPRIMGLDGMRKMSKSLGNAIGMLESDASIATKLRPAFTDPQRQRRTDPGRPEVCNIFRMHQGVTSQVECEVIERKCRSAAFGCGDCKKELAASLSARLGPIRERAAALAADPEAVEAILLRGAMKARAMAQQTLREVRERMGLRPDPRGT